VSTAPLTGTIDGRDFTAKSALASKSFSDASKKDVEIYDVDATCAARPQMKDGSREILTSVPWKAAATDFGFPGQTATFVVQKGNTPDNLISTEGRVEVVNAPSNVGDKGQLRLRAIFEANSVEGQIDVQVCE
jgi:hypothetical protein